MIKRLQRIWKDERGITALETAIILIAFVVVAAVFAFTVLSAGTFLTERSKEAAYAGLEEVQGSVELKGSVTISGTHDAIACGQSSTVSDTASYLYFNLANVAGGRPVDLTDAVGEQVVRMQYRDDYQSIDLNAETGNQLWWVSFVGSNDGDEILEGNELAQIKVDLREAATGGPLSCALWKNQTFELEIIPPQGGVYEVERTTPAGLTTVTDLN
jgi:flagellin FlaB